jgi:hypothetical protein
MMLNVALSIIHIAFLSRKLTVFTFPRFLETFDALTREQLAVVISHVASICFLGDKASSFL